jgi:hypothetical protein
MLKKFTKVVALVEVDRGARVRALLTRIQEADALIAKTSRMTLAAWYEIAQLLAEQKKLMPSTQAFGKWCREQGLNTGLLKSPFVRAKVRWMGEHLVDLQSCKSISATHPTGVVKQYQAWEKGQHAMHPDHVLPNSMDWIANSLKLAGKGLAGVAQQMQDEGRVTQQMVEDEAMWAEQVQKLHSQFVAELAKHPESIAENPEPPPRPPPSSPEELEAMGRAIAKMGLH